METIDDNAESTARRRVNRELGMARRMIAAVRNFYLGNLIVGVVLPPALILLGAEPAAIAASFGAAMLIAFGWTRMPTRPFACSLLIACIWTALLGAWLSWGQFLIYELYVLATLWTLGCWMLLPMTLRMHKLMDRYPDLWVTKKLRAERKGSLPADQQ